MIFAYLLKKDSINVILLRFDITVFSFVLDTFTQISEFTPKSNND